MRRLEDMVAGLREYVRTFNFEMADITERNAQRIADQNVEQQYKRGIRRDGRQILPPYAPSTIRRKQRKGQPTSHVTLRDTGAMHSRLQVSADDADLFLYSDRPYVPHLIERYGEEIFGLTDEAAARLAREVYQPAMLAALRRRLKL